MFKATAVEMGGEEIRKPVETESTIIEETVAKVEQQVNNPGTEVTAENIEVADDTWRENLPVKQKEKGFLKWHRFITILNCVGGLRPE